MLLTLPAFKHNNLDKRSLVSMTDYKRLKQNKNNSVLSRAAYLAKVRENSASKFICEHCGKEAHRKLSGTNQARGSGNKFCSMACRCLHAAVAQQRRCKVVKEIVALKRIARYVEAPSVFRWNCLHCNVLMIVRRNGGLHKKVCDGCMAEKRRADRYIAKLRRKASFKFADSDPINPIKVFERDKWRCHICGIRTPKAKRGTYADDAPELEHIVSLSCGGTHTWGNVACSCRKCNRVKGAASFGQLGLRFAV